MVHQGAYTFIVLLSFAVSMRAKSQYCSPITLEALGNTSSFTTSGLLSDFLVRIDAAKIMPPVRVVDFNVVCHSPGPQRNTFSYASVLVQFQCKLPVPNGLARQTQLHCDGESVHTWQFQFMCVLSGTIPSSDRIPIWIPNHLVPQTKDPTATLTTPLETRCRRCIDDRIQPHPNTHINATTHCECEFMSVSVHAII